MKKKTGKKLREGNKKQTEKFGHNFQISVSDGKRRLIFHNFYD